MATYDSVSLLGIFNRLTGRPSSDAITDPSKYQRLTEAQAQIVADIAGIFPDCLYPAVGYSSIPTLATTDSQTFTFGTDSNGYALAPMGRVGIFSSLNDIPSNPWREGRDYIALGGTAIQIPNNNTYGGTLYWRGITPPGDINATTGQPVLLPEGARLLIPHRAAIGFCLEANRNPDLGLQLQAQYGRPFGTQPGMFAQWMQVFRTAFRNGGALGTFTGMQLALGSSSNSGSY